MFESRESVGALVMRTRLSLQNQFPIATLSYSSKHLSGSLEPVDDDQISRNQYLDSEIVKLDKEIADIKKLKEMTASLLARKKVVETLQSNRSDVVHLLDELTRQLPEGIYLKAIKQAGNRVTINGYTQSQARVSTLMRNLESSPYLENANLIEIKAVTTPSSRVNEFTLNFQVKRVQPAAASTAVPAAAPAKAPGAAPAKAAAPTKAAAPGGLA